MKLLLFTFILYLSSEVLGADKCPPDHCQKIICEFPKCDNEYQLTKDPCQCCSECYEVQTPSISRNLIIWFRNETTFLVLWMSPDPATIHSRSTISIDPPDAKESVIYVERQEEPSGPVQVTFEGLIPGKVYNISVHTDGISTPATALYRTVPLKPQRIYFNADEITTHSFVVHWDPPSGKSEFDKYQVFLGTDLKLLAKSKEDPMLLEFKDNLEPGKTYSVVVKTVSGRVASLPVIGDVTLKPLPVNDVRTKTDEKTGTITVSWRPDPSSTQDSYMVSYHDVREKDTATVYTKLTEIGLEALLPARNYSITVQAVAKDQQSSGESINVETKPREPVIEDLQTMIDR